MAIVCCLLTAFVGCGESKQVVENRAYVTGTVVFDGKPLPAGMIGFQSTERTVSTAVPIRNGVYFTDRAPLGNNTVTVDTSSAQIGNPAKYVPIPTKYNESTTSGLTADIQPGENENVNFALEKN